MPKQSVQGLFARKSNIQLQSVVLKTSEFSNQLHGADYIECCAESNKQHSDVGVVRGGRWRWIHLCGFIEFKLVSVQAGWDVVLDQLV